MLWPSTPMVGSESPMYVQALLQSITLPPPHPPSRDYFHSETLILLFLFLGLLEPGVDTVLLAAKLPGCCESRSAFHYARYIYTDVVVMH